MRGTKPMATPETMEAVRRANESMNIAKEHLMAFVERAGRNVGSQEDREEHRGLADNLQTAITSFLNAIAAAAR